MSSPGYRITVINDVAGDISAWDVSLYGPDGDVKAWHFNNTMALSWTADGLCITCNGTQFNMKIDEIVYIDDGSGAHADPDPFNTFILLLNLLPPGNMSVVAPTVSTTSLTPAGIDVYASCTVSDNGGAGLIERGVVWNTTGSPTISDNKVVTDDSGAFGIGDYTSIISDPETLIYVKAYATNKAGTSYGDEISIDMTGVGIPTLTTDSYDAYYNNSADISCTVTSDGGSPILSRGVVWNTTGSPTVLDNMTDDVDAIVGSYTDNIIGLGSSTVYVKAYAHNANGVGYGNELSFMPLMCLIEGTKIALVNGESKNIEDITYNDILTVWNFDEGKFDEARPLWIKMEELSHNYHLLIFSDGTELRTLGHRIFNKEHGKFTSTMTDETPIGTTTFNMHGEEITLVSKETINESAKYYNIITDTHINLFANCILTSCRLNNIYPISDMKFVKESRLLRSKKEYAVSLGYNAVVQYHDGLRLGEQEIPIKELTDYINRLVHTEAVFAV